MKWIEMSKIMNEFFRVSCWVRMCKVDNCFDFGVNNMGFEIRFVLVWIYVCIYINIVNISCSFFWVWFFLFVKRD